MVRPIDRIVRPARAGRPDPAVGEAPEKPAPDPELLTRRDRLIEKFTLLQSDIGGAFYEMAIRDHVRVDVLTKKAAELQKLDVELADVERAIALEKDGAIGICANCSAPYGPGVAFCAQCGQPLGNREESAA
jgi:hypothetical protein